MPKHECLWVKCIGEAHSRAVAGNMDHCGVCMPWWEWYPVCPTCGKRLTETTPSDWPLVNRDSPHRLWCKTCHRHVAWVVPPTSVTRVADPEANAMPITPAPAVVARIRLPGERTTDLEALKHGADYTWGAVVAIHGIGPYAVVEYHPWKRTENRMVLTGQPDPDDTEYGTYVDGRNCSHSYGSLDAALAGCIAYRVEGPNHHADAYFIRSIADWPPRK